MLARKRMRTVLRDPKKRGRHVRRIRVEETLGRVGETLGRVKATFPEKTPKGRGRQRALETKLRVLGSL
jgi:hypothetical protein